VMRAGELCLTDEDLSAIGTFIAETAA
jgi:hypothetical protein